MNPHNSITNLLAQLERYRRVMGHACEQPITFDAACNSYGIDPVRMRAAVARLGLGVTE